MIPLNTSSAHANLLTACATTALIVISTSTNHRRSKVGRLLTVLRHSISLFLAAARLILVMGLNLSSTIEHIFTLELHIHGDLKIGIKFQGQRPRRYQNEDDNPKF